MRKALLIGINNYPGRGNALRGCLADINALQPLLERNGDGALNFDVCMLPDVASSSKAMEYIEQLFGGDDEIALLYFSGHGYVNTTGAEIVFPDNLRRSSDHYMGLQMSSILEIVNRSRCQNKVVILDCCYSGNMGKYSPAATTSMMSNGVTILTACRDDETSGEMGGHGLFTELLCDALRGGAADFLGNITLGGIYAYIDRAFGAWDQRPMFKTNVHAFSALRKVTPKVETEEIRKLTSIFIKPDVAYALDSSYEFSNVEGKEGSVAPYANPIHVDIFKTLQRLEGIGFVAPIGEEHMYYAAMHGKSCCLTSIGRYYWRLVNQGRI